MASGGTDAARLACPTTHCRYNPKGRGRYIALGFVPDERFVLVVFEYDPKTRWVRVVTAHEAEHERWWKIYAKAKKPKP